MASHRSTLLLWNSEKGQKGLGLSPGTPFGEGQASVRYFSYAARLDLLQELFLETDFQNSTKLAKVTKPSYIQRTGSLFRWSLWIPVGSFKSGVENYGSRIIDHLTPACFYKQSVTGKQSNTHLFPIVYGSFRATVTEPQ